MGYRERKKGFTLVELVVVMVILGITATAAVSFLWMGTKMFVGLSNRVQLSTVAHNFMMRLRLQVESAMPYSLSAETNSYTGNPSRTALSMVIPKGSYRIAQISGTDTIFLPLEEKDPLCKYLKSTNPELRYLNENHTYSSITIPKNSLKTLSGNEAGANCAAGVYKITTSSNFTENSYIRSGTKLYFVDDLSKKIYYADTGGTLYYKEGSTDARPMNISSVEDHGYRYDIFKIDDGVTTVTNTNSVTVSIKLSGGDDFITVSQRFELHSK